MAGGTAKAVVFPKFPLATRLKQAAEKLLCGEPTVYSLGRSNRLIHLAPGSLLRRIFRKLLKPWSSKTRLEDLSEV
jgi:hypothetical protein